MEGKKPIILIAEDEIDLMEMYAMAFSSKGFEVLQAKNGKEALEWLEREGSQIRIVLTDIVMPGFDGFELLEKMKKDDRFKKIPVFISSNLGSESDRQAAFSLGAKDYFEKVQWDPAKLATKMKEIVDGKK